MEPLKSPYGNNPQNMAPPAPGKAAKQTAADLLAEIDLPEMQAPPQEEEANAAALLAQAGGESLPPQDELVDTVGSGVPEDQIAPEPGFVQANMEQFDNFKMRLKAGLAANDREKLGFLRNSLGKENAIVKNGNIYFRKSQGDKFKRFDPETFEVVADVFPDFAREALTEAFMLPGEVAGGAIAGPGGAVAGRVATVAPANMAVDEIAKRVGIPQDEGRSQMVENAVGMGAEAVLPFAGKHIVKRLPGTMAYKMAREAGERESIALSKQSQEVARSAMELANEGRAAVVRGELVGVPGGEVNLMGHHLNPDDPRIQSIVNHAANDPRFINAQRRHAEDWGELVTNTLQEIGRRNNPGPYTPEKLASSVTNAVADVQRAEGKEIAYYKAKSMAALKNVKTPLPPEVNSQLQRMLQELNFTPRQEATKTLLKRDGSNLAGEKATIYADRMNTRTVWSPPRDMGKLLGKFGLTSEGEVRSLVNVLDEVQRASGNGGMRISDLERLRNTVGTLSDQFLRTPAGAELGALSGGLRKQYRDVISSGLQDPIEKKGFESAMDDFSVLMDNIKVLKHSLNEDASAKAIVNSFFTGKENLQKIKAIKQVSPESFAGLREEFANKLLVDFANRKSPTGYNSEAFLSAIDKKYGKEFLSEVFNDGKGANLDTLRKVLTVNERIESQFKNITADNASEAQKKGAMNILIGLLADMKFKSVNGVTAVLQGSTGKDKLLFDIMTRDGIDRYVASYPGKVDKKTVAKNLADMMAQNKVMRMVGPKIEKGIIPRAGRRLLIDEKIKPGDKFEEDQNF